MSYDIRQPFINDTSLKGQLAQIKSYLHQLVDQLRWIFDSIEKSHPAMVSSFLSAEIGEWSYVKYSNGLYQLQGSFIVSPTATVKSDAWYRTTRICLDVPFAIKTAMVTGNTNGYSVITSATKDPERDNGIVFRLLGDKDLTGTKVTVRLVVSGQC